MPQIYFHIDVNSAFLSWSAVLRLQNGDSLDIRSIPSIIGGDISKRHGVVLAKSIPAKRFNIHTGEPITDALKKCPSLLIVPPERTWYSQCSHQMIHLLHQFSPEISQYSIDECFMTYMPEADGLGGANDSMTALTFDDRTAGAPGGPAAYAAMIKDTIRERFGFTVNIGISTNKLLAKMASDFEKPDKVHTLFPEEVPQKMWPLPVRDLFLVGRSTASRLELLGIKTIGDLAHMDPAILTAHLKSHGKVIWEYANGIEGAAIDTHSKREAKGIGNSITVDHDVADRTEAHQILLSLSESVCTRLRHSNADAGMVSVEIKYSSFISVSHQMQLVSSTQTTRTVYQTACRLFDDLWNGEAIRLLGIRTSRLSDAGVRQLSLFDQVVDEKQEKLDKALDNIRGRFGKDAVVRGSFFERK